MSLAFAPPLLAFEFRELFGLAIFILFLLQGLRPKKKPEGTSAPAPPRAPSQTSDHAPAAEPMARPEGAERPSPARHGPTEPDPSHRDPSHRDPWRRGPQSQPSQSSQQPQRTKPTQPSPSRKRERLVPQAAEQGPGSLESRRSAARTGTVTLPAPGEMSGGPSARSGARSAARPGVQHEHLVDLGDTSLKSSRHPGMSPTEAAAPKQRQFVNTGRALLGSGLTGRDRLRGAFAWSVIFGRPKARTFGQPSRRD